VKHPLEHGQKEAHADKREQHQVGVRRRTVMMSHSDHTIIERLQSDLGREVGGSRDAGNHINGKRATEGAQGRSDTLIALD
jgi:hypothetical protein